MKSRKGAFLAAAALAGLVAGTNARVSANPLGQDDTKTTPAKKVKKEKHACAGKNSCKGKGGCKTSDAGCKGKNSCKGKGGCATDGSKGPEAV